MAKTSASSNSPYATVEDLFLHADWRKIADWCSDDDTRPTRGELANSVSDAGAIVAAKLAQASGLVESACLAGGRYTAADLNALTGVSREYLRGLICSIAAYHLSQRRNPTEEPSEAYVVAQEAVEQLRKGERIFGFVETADAGAGFQIAPLHQEQVGRTVQRASRFFGPRGGDR